APPAEDVRETVAETVAELKYNLARAHDDAGRPDRALPLFEALHASDHEDYRYVEGLVRDLIATGDRRRAREVLDRFDARCGEAAPEAEAELRRRREERPDSELDGYRYARDQREIFLRRRLAERATGFPALRGLLRLKLDLVDERFEEGLLILRQHYEGHAETT